jgi:lysozyme
MNIEPALELIREFEGFVSKPYICPAGIPTIGYGTTRYPDGKRVTLYDAELTQKQAEQFLDHDVSTFKLSLAKSSPNLLQEPNQFCAILSFCYNLGMTNYRASTLKRKIDKDETSDVPEQLARWVFAGGRKQPGLIRRRQAESDLFTKKIILNVPEQTFLAGFRSCIPFLQ